MTIVLSARPADVTARNVFDVPGPLLTTTAERAGTAPLTTYITNVWPRRRQGWLVAIVSSVCSAHVIVVDVYDVPRTLLTSTADQASTAPLTTKITNVWAGRENASPVRVMTSVRPASYVSLSLRFPMPPASVPVSCLFYVEYPRHDPTQPDPAP